MQTQILTGVETVTECYYSPLVGAELTAVERFRQRVYAVMKDKGLTQRRIALKVTGEDDKDGWLSNKLRGYRDIKLDEAEDIARAVETPLAELLRKPEDRVYELDPWEGRLIEAFRQLTAHEQEAFVTAMTLRHRPAPYVSGKAFARQQAKHLSQGAQDAQNRAAALAAAADDPIGQILLSAVKQVHAVLRRQIAGTGTDGPVVPPRGRKIR